MKVKALWKSVYARYMYLCCELCIFRGCHNHLDLSCGVPLCSKTFMVDV